MKCLLIKSFQNKNEYTQIVEGATNLYIVYYTLLPYGHCSVQ